MRLAMPGSIESLAGDMIGNVVGQFFDGVGGLSGLRKRFEDQDLAHVYQSWLTKRHNSVDPEDVRRIAGSDAERLAKAHGLQESEVVEILSEHLPQRVSQVTPSKSKD